MKTEKFTFIIAHCVPTHMKHKVGLVGCQTYDQAFKFIEAKGWKRERFILRLVTTEVNPCRRTGARVTYNLTHFKTGPNYFKAFGEDGYIEEISYCGAEWKSGQSKRFARMNGKERAEAIGKDAMEEGRKKARTNQKIIQALKDEQKDFKKSNPDAKWLQSTLAKQISKSYGCRGFRNPNGCDSQ